MGHYTRTINISDVSGFCRLSSILPCYDRIPRRPIIRILSAARDRGVDSPDIPRLDCIDTAKYKKLGGTDAICIDFTGTQDNFVVRTEPDLST